MDDFEGLVVEGGIAAFSWFLPTTPNAPTLLQENGEP